MSHTILITDDDPSITSIFEFMLVQNGYNCLKAASVSEASQIVQSNHEINLVFLDFQLHANAHPNGLAQLHQHNPFLPVLLMMSYPNDRELKTALNLDAFGIIYKPFDINEILSLISETFEHVKG